MYCPACGAENPAHALACVKCSAGLGARCAHCGAGLPAGARFCPGCGRAATVNHSAAQPERVDLPRESVAERKQVTVLFADLAGFTTFVHQSDVEDVRDYMSSLWGRLDAIIAAHGGLTEKHIGDAIIAVFGGKQAREDDPVQAVRTALEMQSCLSEMPGEGAAPLRLRIGIHTGLVVVGPLGPAGEITATGDAVNLANRLEQHAPPGGILVSHDTYRQVYGLFDVTALPEFQVKGRPEPVQACLILRAKPRALARQLRGVEGLEIEMVGRAQQLKRLQSALERVMAARESQVFTIVGEAGLGKTCLVREFQKWLELLPQNVRFFCGRATSEMAGLPFALMRDVFAARFEIQDSDSAAVAREKLERGLMNLLGAGAEAGVFAGEEAQLQAHFIGQLLGLDFSASPWLRDILNDTEQIRQRAFHSFTRFFNDVSGALGPVAGGSAAAACAAGGEAAATVLVAEDIHWSDEGSLDLLAHLGRTCGGVPLLLICVARPTLFERRPDWANGLPRHERLDLEPLSRPESLALVETILRKTPELPQALRELIVGGAEGIPFYIEEIIKMLIDQKVILPGAERWRVETERLAAAQVPPTLTGVLQARLDSLLPAERLVLQRASVIGRVFWDSAVERLSSPVMTPSGGATAAEALVGLRRKELVFRREASAFAGAVEFIFKHELLRNVAYESLLKKQRREYHAQAAQWLLEQSGERSNEFAGLIAFHFEQAARPTDAAEWYGRAGQQARTGYAPAAAIDYFRKALGLIPAGPAEEKRILVKRLEWQEGLGEALAAQARFAEALEASAGTRALAETLGDAAAQARAWNGLAFLNERLGRNRASVECAERAEVLAREAGEAGHAERIRALHLKGWACYRLSDAPAVLALANQTLELCLQSGDRRGRATSFKLHGVAHLQLGQFLDADRFFEQGLALYQELGDRRNTAAMWSNLGESARLRGDCLAAEELYQKALATAREIGHRESEAVYLTNLSGARLGLQKFVEVENDAREAVALSAAANSCALSAAYSFLSEACLGQGKLSEALEAARRALALAREAENDMDIGSAWRTLGQAVAGGRARVSPARPEISEPSQRRSGDRRAPPLPSAIDQPSPEAVDCFAESLRVFKNINAQGEQARTLRAWAEFDLRQDRVEAGRAKLEEARSIFRHLGAEAEVARTETLLQDASGQTYS